MNALTRIQIFAILILNLLFLGACNRVESMHEVGYLDIPITNLLIEEPYLYVGGPGVAIYSLDDPLHPQLVGEYDSWYGTHQFSISDDYGFLASWSASLEVVDLREPNRPIPLTPYRYSIQAAGVATHNNVAYFVDGGPYFKGIHILDIRDPSSLIEIANLPDIGAYSNGGVQIVVEDEYLFVKHRNGPDFEYDLIIFDVSDPSTPHEISRIVDIGAINEIEIDQDRLYVVSVGRGLSIYDITNISNPKRIGFYRSNLPNSAVAVDGDYAYLTDLFTVKTLDISNIKQPRVVAEKEMDQAWDVAMYDSYVYVADSDGLFIFKTRK
ncbi:MAG: hypothetical protein H6642_15460 [Caldilineaceae bacterium]|nr:hypothetical protein [Caldilineaceae bacterium]